VLHPGESSYAVDDFAVTDHIKQLKNDSCHPVPRADDEFDWIIFHPDTPDANYI